jgi:protein-tyrosine phosphatase
MMRTTTIVSATMIHFEKGRLFGIRLQRARGSKDAKVSLPDLRWIKEIEPHRLAITARPRGGEWLEGDITAWRRGGVDLVVSLIDSEEERELELELESVLCRASGIEFLSFPIRDRSVPNSPDATASLVDWVVSDLRRGRGVAIHCRLGIGRTGLVAGCVLRALGHAHDTVFPMLSRARGLPVPDTAAQAEWVRRFQASAAPTGVRP